MVKLLGQNLYQSNPEHGKQKKIMPTGFRRRTTGSPTQKNEDGRIDEQNKNDKQDEDMDQESDDLN